MVKVIDETVARLINKLFGGMIEEISAESISISAVHGTARLENLTVRPQWMAGLGLPVLLNAGTVGKIDIDIPVTALRSRPIRISVKDILVSVSPNPSVNVKKAQLEKDLAEQKIREDERRAGKLDRESKLGKLMAKIAANLIVLIENVHVRFEDTLSRQQSWNREWDKSRCFSLGLTLDRFEMRGCVLSPDGEWQPRCVKAFLRFLNKSVCIGRVTARKRSERGSRVLDLTGPAGLGIYLQHGERPLSLSDARSWAAEMLGFIASADDVTGNHWLVGPVSAEARASFDTQTDFTPCSSRIWRDALPTSAYRFIEEELAGGSRSAGIEAAVQIEQSQMRDTVGTGHLLHVNWCFESEKDAVGFEVLYLPGDGSGSGDGDGDSNGEPVAWVHLQPCTRAESSSSRVFGSCVVPSAGGTILLRWNNAPTKTKASLIRYVLWLRRTSKSGGSSRPRDVECAVLADDDLATLLHRQRPPQPKLETLKIAEDEMATDASLGSQTEVEVVTGEVALNLHHRSLEDLAAMQNWYANVQTWQAFEYLRPRQPVTSRGRIGNGMARAWWQFAITFTIESLPSHIFRTKLRQYVEEAKEYASLFKRRYSAGRPWLVPLSEVDQARLEELEARLPIDMVRSRRKASWYELEQDEQMKNNQLRDARETEAKLLSGPPSETVEEMLLRGNAILNQGWLFYDKVGNGKLKRRYLTLATVTEYSTLYSGWMTVLPLNTPTASNGEVQRRQSIVLQRWWFQLRNGCLRWFVDQEQKGCRGVLELLPSFEVQQRPGSADCWEIRTGDAATGLLLRCDSHRNLKAWVAATLTATGKGSPMVPEVRRWLLVAKVEGGTPTEAIQLKKEEYTLSRVGKVRLKLEERLLSVASSVGNGTVRHCRLATAAEDVESSFKPLLALLEQDAGASVHLSEGEGLVRMDSRGGDSQAATGGEDDEEPTECGTELTGGASTGVATSTFLVRRVVVLISKVTVILGVAANDDRVEMYAETLRLDTSSTNSGGIDVAASIQDLGMQDLCSRDSCCPQLLQRMVPFQPTPWDRASRRAAGGGDELEERPVFRFRYKKTYRSDAEENLVVAVATPKVSPPEGVPPPLVPSLQLELESGPEADVFINMVMQPLRFVVPNPALWSLIQSFGRLSGDEALEALGVDIVRGLRRIDFSKLEDMSRLAEKSETVESGNLNKEELGIEHRRILVQFRALELMLADNLSNLCEDAVAVRIQLDSFDLRNSDFPAASSCTPRSADSSWLFRCDSSYDSGGSSPSPSWTANLNYTPRSPRLGYGFGESESSFIGSDSWDSDTAMIMGGSAVNFRIVASSRDDEWTDRSVLLKPTIVETNLRISTVPPTSTRGEWVKLDVDVAALDFQLDRWSVKVLLRVLSSALKSSALFKPPFSQARAASNSPKSYHGPLSPMAAAMEPRPIGAIKANQIRRFTSNPAAWSQASSDQQHSTKQQHPNEPQDPRLQPRKLGRKLEPVILRSVNRIRKVRMSVELGQSLDQYNNDADDRVDSDSIEVGDDACIDVLLVELTGAELGVMLTPRCLQTVLHGQALSYEIKKRKLSDSDSPLPSVNRGHAIPIGLSTITSYTTAVSVTRYWLYNVAEPDNLVPFSCVGDLQACLSPSEVKAVLPLLMLGMRVATLKDGVSALRGDVGGHGGDCGQRWRGIQELQAVAAQATTSAAALRSPGGSLMSVTAVADSSLDNLELSHAMLQFVRNMIGARLWEQIVPALNGFLDFAGGAAEKVDSARAHAHALGLTHKDGHDKNDFVAEQPFLQPLAALEILSAKSLQGRLDTFTSHCSPAYGQRTNEPEAFSLDATEPEPEQATDSGNGAEDRAPDFRALPLAELQLLCVALGAKPHTVARSPVRAELQHATKDELNDALVASLNKQSYVWQHIQKATIADGATKI